MSQSSQDAIRLDVEKEEILHLLKNGRSDQVMAMMEMRKKQNYPNEFVPFMDQMVREHKISRKDVAVKSGLSQDYVYKLLRGDKRTGERDYILAMCFAIGMNLPQTQHALSSYGMPILSTEDIRSLIIIHAIQNGDGIDELDNMLEKANFPLLKTSPDMPSAAITSTVSAEYTPQGAQVDTVPVPARRKSFEEIDSFTEAYPNGGGAPFDYDYTGWFSVKDEEGHIYRVEARFADDPCFLVYPEGKRDEAIELLEQQTEKKAEFFAEHMEELTWTDDGICFGDHPELREEYEALIRDLPREDGIECYETFEEAAASAFFTYFLKLDRLTDKKVLEVMSRVDDTREYGCRMGSAWHGPEQPKIYIEMFNNEQPERREYFQLVEYADGSCRYTATHESCFMQIEMGRDLYQAYFGPNKREPEYYIDTDKNDFSGDLFRYRFIFSTMKMLLHEHALEAGGIVHLDPDAVREEKIEFLIERGTQMHLCDDENAALSCYKEAIQLMESCGAPEQNHLAAYVCTCYKIADTLSCLKEPDASEWWQKIYKLKDAVTAVCETDPEQYEGALSSVADAALIEFRSASEQREKDTPKRLLEEILCLMDRYHASADDWPLQFEVYGNHAMLIEDEDLERSLKEYRKALTIARDHHLDQLKPCARAVAVQYNNYAWVLWNKCGSEEAILYYGRALDLLESYLSTGMVDRDIVLKELKHMGSALNRIYIDTGRTRESAHLKERLEENGVKLD